MKKDEFITKAEEMGINLEYFRIFPGVRHEIQYSVGTYYDEEWIMYRVDERDHLQESFKGEEDTAFNKLYDALFRRLFEFGYINHSITETIVETSKTKVFEFLKDQYSMEDWKLQETWDYLSQNLRVLNEVKYFAVNKSFVPEKDAYALKGYTAEKIFNETYLTEIGAYNYLIYLGNNPEQALANLNAGLPRK